MINSMIEVESTLTDRYQTTIPETVRKALHLDKRDKIHYVIQGNGNVLITRAEKANDDPAIEEFLSFIAKDIQKHPENVMAINKELYNKIKTLVSGIEIDLNKHLLDEDE